MNPSGNPDGEQAQPALAEAARHRTVLDVSAQRIARVYAEALIGAAGSDEQANEVVEELGSLLHDVFPADPRFEAFLAAPAIGRRTKAEVLRKVFGGRASKLFLNFLLVLNDHERLDLLRGIYKAARDLLDERARRIRVQVRSAVPLADDQRERLAQELRQAFRLEPVLETRVDPELIGGMVVRVGDWLYDASVRTRLETLRKQLIERSSYEIQSRRDHFSSDT
ncbi:MAG TPA: ATP synthase F1 subunit delta [Gemmataceae bacterium]|jgi:F-type H+-transporting ATPase subunit delta|nr:ATP synthase F1 subunit delta [Gemmataceae bacterium]